MSPTSTTFDNNHVSPDLIWLITRNNMSTRRVNAAMPINKKTRRNSTASAPYKKGRSSGMPRAPRVKAIFAAERNNPTATHSFSCTGVRNDCAGIRIEQNPFLNAITVNKNVNLRKKGRAAMQAIDRMLASEKCDTKRANLAMPAKRRVSALLKANAKRKAMST
mmetsp:Transcript_5983/g.15423  ORF Transcript_5983/g.15423 Transcript_5983/m.15423 type:complete len:164 (-) Transcript_5983:262-753(-)